MCGEEKDKPETCVCHILCHIAKIVSRHWRTMKKDPYLAEVFPLPPLVAYKRPPNIKDKLIRAKVPEQPPLRPKRNLTGIKKCNNCPI